MARVAKRQRGAGTPPPNTRGRSDVLPPVLLDAGSVRRGQTVSKGEVAGWLQSLESMTLEDLRAEWRVRFQGEVPAIQSRDVLRRLIAWRVQAALFGGLSPETVRALRHLMADHNAGKPLVTREASRLTPGTVLTRIWKGRSHTVTVEDAGYVYEDKTYSSLSEIARLITGTRWSGPRLFGLEKPAGRGT